MKHEWYEDESSQVVSTRRQDVIVGIVVALGIALALAKWGADWWTM